MFQRAIGYATPTKDGTAKKGALGKKGYSDQDGKKK